MKDYYKILNVKNTANEEDIKRSYRILAKKYHPDVNPGDAMAADRFADINEAHDTLSDPVKRAEYDKKLMESAAPKQRPEDIIARQRAAAQAAARQAAARQSAIRMNLRHGDPTMTMAQRVAAAQARVQAQVQAQQQAQAQAQAHQYQAQLTQIEQKAYNTGHSRGLAEARQAAEREINAVKAELRTVKLEMEHIKDQLASTESDRSDLEQELFHRDRELSQAKSHSADLERRLASVRKSTTKNVPQHTAEEYDVLHAKLEKAQARIGQLEQALSQAELKNRAQIDLQQDKRRHLQEQIDALNQKVHTLTAENEELKAENEQWQQYAKGEDFISDAEAKMADWDKKQRVDKKLAKSTLYGNLGVLIWATDDEINAAYKKLVKRYGSKNDDASKERIAKIEAAYEVLSDPEKRTEYNHSIDISDERIEDERRKIEEYKKLESEYRSQLENKEFWAKFDELNFNAQTGDADAQNGLGEMYYYGDEIEKDYEQAVYWFKEAAKQKHADAMFNLGMCFINGEGLERNQATGLGFVRQAAKLGSKSAIQYMKKS